MFAAGTILDGYRLIRPIGRGGFGEVWLCASETTGDWRALKFVAEARAQHFEKEFDALVRYRRVSAQLRSPSLMAIEHVNRADDGIFYVMPLADGTGADSPEDPHWKPYTLAADIRRRQASGNWFSCTEIESVFSAILDALQLLADNGLVHRDVKPDNILCVAGRPCLGDISLLGEDKTDLSQCGTPGYMTPSWYVGGHADMYGAAFTLYMLLTGNNPDKFGRAGYRRPPHTLPPEEMQHWERMYRATARALDERQSERFPDFASFRRALKTPATPAKFQAVSPAKFSFPRVLLTGTALIAGTIGGLFLYGNFAGKTKAAPDVDARLVAAYDDIAHAMSENRAEFERYVATVLGRNGKIPVTEPMPALAEKFYAERVKADGNLPATPAPAQVISCLELALFRMNEQLFAQAAARPATPAEHDFFRRNVAPALRKELTPYRN